MIASHSQKAQWLYPTPSLPIEGDEDQSNGDTSTRPPDDPNKYRPFAQMEHTLTTNLRHLISSTSPTSLSDPSTMTAGALTMALAYISKLSLSTQTSLRPSTSAFDSSTGNFTTTSSDPTSDPRGLTSRVLILSLSGDLSAQYIPMMNAIFACQRIRTPIDILKLAGDTVFLQQAADATGGVYMSLSSSEMQKAGLLQYLMQAYLPDPSARKLLRLPGATHGVDFRAACFCHRRIVDIGFVCSICLSIFCEPLVGDGSCLTCGMALSIGNYGTKPVVIARKRPKKKRKLAGADGREGTPASGADTPGP